MPSAWTRLFAGLVLGLSVPLPVLAMGHLHADRPEAYPALDPSVVRDGVIDYTVDLHRLLNVAGTSYTPEDVPRLEAAVVRAFDMWNEVLAPLGLRFERVDRTEDIDLPVFTFDYERLLPPYFQIESIAGAHSFSVLGLYVWQLPLIFDSTEVFADLSETDVVADRPLAHPYTCFTAEQSLDITSVALHEIGHVLGMAHPSDSHKQGKSFNFLALDSVRVDGRCLRTSAFLCGEHVDRRRPLLRTELDSVMKVPIEFGIRYAEIPPADRAFVAFALRYLNPHGADEVLARARQMFRETSPLRFANVITEFERAVEGAENNNILEHAQTVEPNTIVLGSISLVDAPNGEAEEDVDVYAFEVTEATLDAVWVFDIDMGAGLLGTSWVDAQLELRDASGATLAEVDDVEKPDEGSLSELDPFLEYRFASPGTYYLLVRSAVDLTDPDGSGDYELKIGVGGVPEPTGVREPIPALVDPSVAECIGAGPIDTSAVPCMGFGILAGWLAVWVLSFVRRVRAPEPRFPQRGHLPRRASRQRES